MPDLLVMLNYLNKHVHFSQTVIFNFSQMHCVLALIQTVCGNSEKFNAHI